MVAPFVGVVDVEVGGGDVVVAGDDEARVFAFEVVNVARRGVEPVQFVGVFFISYRFAIGDVEVEDARSCGRESPQSPSRRCPCCVICAMRALVSMLMPD